MNADEQLFEGSCLCGQVRYRAIGPFVDMLHCHCTDCQKCHGGAFMTGVGVKPGQFTIVQGQDRLQMFQAESGTRRSFCRTCGSKVKVENDRWKETYVPAGTFDTPLKQRPDLHMYVRSKVPWFEIQDGLPQHATDPE
jgi:hypothetical protein